MIPLSSGLQAELSIIVSEADTAACWGSGLVLVYSAPALVESNMYLIPFEMQFPEIAYREIRSFTLSGSRNIPEDDIGLLESYCSDPDCDYQRVMINIVSHSEQRQLATLSYCFDRSAQGAGPFLDPLNMRSSNE